MATARFVRITFEPGSEDETLDLALAALEEQLRAVTSQAVLPYRS